MSKRITYGAILVALAMIFSYIEVLIPFNFGIPGIKLGLANLVVLIGLFILKPQEVFMISLVRILIMGCLFGTGVSLIYSLSGGFISFILMYLLKKSNAFSIISVSIMGGIGHNCGQILAARIVLQNTAVFYYLPVLLIAGLVTGTLIGILSNRILPIISKECQKYYPNS